MENILISLKLNFTPNTLFGLLWVMSKVVVGNTRNCSRIQQSTVCFGEGKIKSIIFVPLFFGNLFYEALFS